MQQTLSSFDLPSRLAFIKRYVPNFDPPDAEPRALVLPVVRRGARLGRATRRRRSWAGSPGWWSASSWCCCRFYFFVVGRDDSRSWRCCRRCPAATTTNFASEFRDVIDATFRGQVMTALAQGVATTIGLAIARRAGRRLWGAVAAMLSLLPMVGAAVVWVPATIYLGIGVSSGRRTGAGDLPGHLGRAVVSLSTTSCGRGR